MQEKKRIFILSTFLFVVYLCFFVNDDIVKAAGNLSDGGELSSTMIHAGDSADATEQVFSGNVRLFNGRGNSILQDHISVDTKYCTVTVTSTSPVYYAFLTLKEKGSTVKQAKLKEASLVDGKYVIDYSSCKPTKAFCLGIGSFKMDYGVDGFSVDYKDEESYQLSTDGKVQTWKGNKYYTCLGSDFDFVLHIDAYYPAEVDRVSTIKWDANYPDDATGEKLIMSAKIKGDINSVFKSMRAESVGTVDTTPWYSIYDKAVKAEKLVQISKKKPRVQVPYEDSILQEYEPYKQKAWTYPFAEKWPKAGNYLTNGFSYYATDFPYDFIWRKKGETAWREASEFTGAMLKEYLQSGVKLEIRFDCIHDCHSGNRGVLNGTQYDWGVRENLVWGDRYDVPQTIKIPKAKVAKAPKITIHAVNDTISIKNGMQYSFDGKNWSTVFPCTALKKFVVNRTGMIAFWHATNPLGYNGYYNSLPPDVLRVDSANPTAMNPPCLFKKISTIPLSELIMFDEVTGNVIFWNNDSKYKNLYVRTLAKGNGLPSEITTIGLPMRSGSPEVTVVNATGGGIKILDILPGSSETVATPSYEVQIADIEEGTRLLREKLTQKYVGKAYDGNVTVDCETSDMTFAWMPCQKGRVITQGKLTAKGIWVSYLKKNNKLVYQLVNDTINIPFTESNSCKISFRRKGVPAGLTIPSESAYCFGTKDHDPSEFWYEPYYVQYQ